MNLVEDQPTSGDNYDKLIEMLGKMSDWRDVAVDVRFPDSLTTAEVGRENVQNGFWKPWCGCDPDGHCIECVCDYEWACPAVTTT